MSLVITEVSSAGIVMVADSAISLRNPTTGAITANQKHWLKLLPVPRIRAAISFWGSIGLISKKKDFDAWIKSRIDDGKYTDLPSFADFLAREMNVACGDKPLGDEHPTGLHVAGYQPWPDGIKRPTFYHIHNGHGKIATQHLYDKETRQLVRTTYRWEGEPRKLFETHQDFPFSNAPLEVNLAQLQSGYLTRNGDFFPYLVIDDGLKRIQSVMNTIPGVSLPDQPTKLASRLNYLAMVMQTVIRIYECSSLTKVVGGQANAISIDPDGGYNGVSSRKSKPSAIRASQLRKLS